MTDQIFARALQGVASAKSAPVEHKVGLAEKIANWLPVVGGIAGSFVPGLGTIVGGALGSAAGSIGKNLLKNSDEDQQNNVSGGEFLGDAAKEGALGLIGGGVGKVAGAIGGKIFGAGAEALGRGVGEEAGQATGQASRFGANLAEKGVDLTDNPNLFQKLGNGMRQSIKHPTLRVSPTSALEERGLANDLQKVQELYGRGTGSAAKQFEDAGKTYLDINKEIESILKDHPGRIHVDDLTSNMRNSLAEIGFGQETQVTPKALAAVKNATDQLINIAGKDAESLTPEQIFKWKNYLADQASPAFKKLQVGSTLSDQDEVYHTLWKEADNLLANTAPEVKDLTMMQSVLHKSVPGLSKSADAALQLPLKIKVPLRPAQAVLDATGKALQGVGGIGSVTPGIAAKTVGQTVSRVPFMAGPAQAANAEAPTDSAINTSADTQSPDMGSVNTTGPTNGNGGITKDMIGQLMLHDLANGGKNIAALDKIASYLVPAEESKPHLGTAQVDKLTAGKVATQQLQDLKDLIPKISNTGRMQILKQGVRKVSPGLAPNSDNEEAFKQSSGQLLSMYVQMLSGAAASDQEREFIQSYLPGLQFTPQENKIRIQGAQKAIQRQMQALTSITSNADVVNTGGQ